jgi:tetratricopeptide (TPR) repeat protein
LARELIHSASAMGDPEATVAIVEGGLKKGDISGPSYVRPLAHLRKMAAPPQSRVEAMNVLGDVYEFQKEGEKALQIFQEAALRPPSLIKRSITAALDNKGPGYSHTKIGTILLRRSDLSGAEAHFRKAALEFDHPLGHYHLARLDKSSSKKKGTSLLKSAGTGFIEAAADLGQLHIERANSTGAGKKEEKATQLKLAKEWLYLAASANNGRGMLCLAQAFKAEGKSKSGLKWLEMAEKHKDAQVAKEAAKMRATF